MRETPQNHPVSDDKIDLSAEPEMQEVKRPLLPLTNYTLSTVCPACDTEMFRLACKVRCKRCGFMWDCSEV